MNSEASGDRQALAVGESVDGTVVPSRRRILTLAPLVILAGQISYVFGRFLTSPVTKRTVRVFQRSNDQSLPLTVQHQSPVFLIEEPGRCEARSDVCPHLGCRLDWIGERQAFVCPCHGSRFDRTGRRIAGPANHDLATLPLEFRGREVLVEVVR